MAGTDTKRIIQFRSRGLMLLWMMIHNLMAWLSTPSPTRRKILTDKATLGTTRTGWLIGVTFEMLFAAFRASKGGEASLPGGSSRGHVDHDNDDIKNKLNVDHYHLTWMTRSMGR